MSAKWSRLDDTTTTTHTLSDFVVAVAKWIRSITGIWLQATLGLHWRAITSLIVRQRLGV
jgi:hypothetical protein